MKQSLAVIVTGLLAGTAGAFIAGHLGSSPVAVVEEARPKPSPRLTITPPGWDDRFVARLASVEAQLGQVKAAQTPARTEATPEPAEHVSLEVNAREGERQAFYDNELDLQKDRLNSHSNEPVDLAWAEAEASRVTQALSGENVPYRIKSIDCRTSSCVSQLAFHSPSEALEYLSSSAPKTPVGCKGLIATPTPPTSAGEYELAMVYNCR